MKPLCCSIQLRPLLFIFIVLNAMLLTACDKTTWRAQADAVHATSNVGMSNETGGTPPSASPMPYGASAPMAPGSDGQPVIPTNAPPASAPVTNGYSGVTASAPPAPVALNATEAQFFAQAAEAMSFEARAAEIAVSRADDSAIKSYAALLLSDQPTVAGGLQLLASRMNVPLPVSLSLARQQTLDSLVQASPESFDRRFVQLEGRDAQQSTIALFEQVMREAQNPSIRDYANGVLAILQAHLSAAQKLPIQG